MLITKTNVNNNFLYEIIFNMKCQKLFNDPLLLERDAIYKGAVPKK
jgi:hypothetical protein